MGNVLLIGNFGKKTSTETLLNFDVLKIYEDRGFFVRIIDFSGSIKKSKKQVPIPISPDKERRTGGIGWKAHFLFLFYLISFTFHSNKIHYLSKSASRPSLFHLLTTSIIGKLMFKRVIATIHSDLFSFLGTQRSRWNGYPLLWTAFSLLDSVFCGDQEIKKVALFYKNSPDKFKVREFRISQDKGKESYSQDILSFYKSHKKLITIFLDEEESGFAKEVSQIISKNIRKTTGIILISNNPTKIGLNKDIFYVNKKEKQLIKSLLFKSFMVIEAANCDGQDILPNLITILRYPKKEGDTLFLDNGIVLIKTDNFDLNIIKNLGNGK